MVAEAQESAAVTRCECHHIIYRRMGNALEIKCKHCGRLHRFNIPALYHLTRADYHAIMQPERKALAK